MTKTLYFLAPVMLFATFLGLGGIDGAKAAGKPDRCAIRAPDSFTAEEIDEWQKRMDRQLEIRHSYPPAPSRPWKPEEDESYMIVDAGRNDDRLAFWTYATNVPCPEEKAKDERKEYGGNRRAQFKIILKQADFAAPERRAERIVETAISVSQKIFDMGYDLDWGRYHIQLLDEERWDHFQKTFAREREKNTVVLPFNEIENCEPTLQYAWGKHPPAQCIVFDYRRRFHLAQPRKSMGNFTSALVASDDVFAKSLRDDCSARKDQTRLCKDLVAGVRRTWLY